MALPKNYSIWLAVDYNGIENAFWYKPKKCEKHREWWGDKMVLPHGSIKKLIGRELSWDDESVELSSSIKTDNMAKYKVGDIFINHKDGKILQVCEGNCNGCLYKIDISTCSYRGTFCRKDIGSNTYFKELPSLPPGTKVKIREDLKVGTQYGQYVFVSNMWRNKEVTIERYFASSKAYGIIENGYLYALEMFDQVISEPKENNNMETKEIKIKVPEGYEIDKENSTFECVKFKPIKKELTYEDVAEELFNNTCYYTNGCGEIIIPSEFIAKITKEDKNNAPNRRQLERLLALNQLLNIAEYYNKKNPKENIYCIHFNKRNLEYFVQNYTGSIVERGLIPKFNREEDAKAVINNPNFKEILDLVYKGNED